MNFLIGCIIGIALVVIFAVLIAGNQGYSKAKAKKILKSGRIENIREFNVICETLSTMASDLEASDLWRKLQALKETYGLDK